MGRWSEAYLMLTIGRGVLAQEETSKSKKKKNGSKLNFLKTFLARKVSTILNWCGSSDSSNQGFVLAASDWYKTSN